MPRVRGMTRAAGKPRPVLAATDAAIFFLRRAIQLPARARGVLRPDRVVCSIYYTQMAKSFGDYIRQRREELRTHDRAFSVRQVASRVGLEPSYLSKIERDEQPPPSEESIRALAEVLGEDPDVLLALAGKVSADLQRIIRARPKLFADLLRQLRDQPDHAVLRLVREVRDGKW